MATAKRPARTRTIIDDDLIHWACDLLQAIKSDAEDRSRTADDPMIALGELYGHWHPANRAIAHVIARGGDTSDDAWVVCQLALTDVVRLCDAVIKDARARARLGGRGYEACYRIGCVASEARRRALAALRPDIAAGLVS